MRIVGKQFGKRPEVMEIEGSLESMQDFVGGYIEFPFVSQGLNNRKILVCCNDSGKIDGLEPTLALVHNREVVDALCGQMFFVGMDGADCCSLDDLQIAYIESKFILDGASCDNGNNVDVFLI